MFPLLPFAIGVVAGVAVLRLVKSEAPRAGLAKAQERLRGVTVSGLEAVEDASRSARERLTHSPAASSEPAPQAPAASEVAPAASEAPAAPEEAPAALAPPAAGKTTRRPRSRTRKDPTK